MVTKIDASMFDAQGKEIILDADADTSITADTDDQIDIKIAGADDFRFTANNFNVLSGSTLTVDSGATITNSGTATGFADFTAIGDGSVSAPSLANSGDTNTGIYFPAADKVGVVAGGTEQFRFGSNPIPSGGMKNLLINGAMTVNQRSGIANTGIGASSGVYVLDRWFQYIDGGPQARVTITSPVADGDAKAAGFADSMLVDCTTAESAVGAAELHSVAQRIEARHCSHLGYGTSSAKTLTCSFWVKSPKSGIHCVSLSCGVTGRTMPTEYTISSANTWENHSVSFAGDTGGTAFTNVTTVGLMLTFPLIAGSNFANTADTWHSTQEHCTSNQQNLLDSTSNNFYLTGVQLEIGSVATDYAHEDAGTTFRKCSRYLQFFGLVAAGEFDRMDGYAWKAASADSINSGYWIVNLDARARMRAAPTFTTKGVGATNWKVYSGNRQLNVISVMTGGGFTQAITTGHCTIYIEVTGTDFVVGNSMILVAGTTAGTYYYFVAEL